MKIGLDIESEIHILSSESLVASRSIVDLIFGIIKSWEGWKMLRSAKGAVEFLTLTDDQRKLIGEKFLDFANIGSGALIFGSALSEGRIKWSYLISGMLLWFLIFCFYLLLTKQRGKKNA